MTSVLHLETPPLPAVDPARHPFSNLTKGRDEWLTPRELISALGPFDLDPSAPITRPWPTATVHFTKLDNGLRLAWSGRVWLNPPYGSQTGKWLGRLVEHGNGIALIFARTETTMFFRHVWPCADAILFLEGRINFYRVDGSRSPRNAGAPNCLIAYGKQNVDALKNSGLRGKIILLQPSASVLSVPSVVKTETPE